MIRRTTRTTPLVLLLGTLLAACDRGDGAAPPEGGVARADSAAPAGPPTYAAAVVQRLPHDPTAFTQGLFFAGGELYESTGNVGESGIRRVDLPTGEVEQRRPLPPPYFGEGSVALDGRLYQLTWRHGKAFVYDLATFAPRDTLTYYGEGWGLTTDGESLIMSDGTARLRFVDPATFAVRRTLDVTDNGSPVSQLNELEWVEGEILANVWESDQIVRIDPKTGAVTGWIDLTGILPPGERTGREDVLNGIAYDSAAKKLYVTGKYWPTLFEIRPQPRR